MTPLQEAYLLMQKQPESNIRLIIDLLHTMSPSKEKTNPAPLVQPFKRTGLAGGIVHLPEDFDEHFDDLNMEITESFYGSGL